MLKIALSCKIILPKTTYVQVEGMTLSVQTCFKLIDLSCL